MKRKARKMLFGVDLRRLGKVEIRTIRDTARTLIESRKKVPPLVIIDPKGRKWEFWDIDMEG